MPRDDRNKKKTFCGRKSSHSLSLPSSLSYRREKAMIVYSNDDNVEYYQITAVQCVAKFKEA